MIVLRTWGIVGREEIQAPDHSNFDRGSIEMWYWLLVYTRKKDFIRQRDKFVNEGKIEVLANCLANCNGMAGTYWILQAREIVSASRA